MSSMQWEFSEQRGTAVVELAGYLNDAALGQFEGAVGWALAAGGGPVILDLGRLQGWSRSGEQAVLKAAARVIGYGRSFALCGGEYANSWAAGDGPWVGIEVYANLAEAITSLEQTIDADEAVVDGGAPSTGDDPSMGGKQTVHSPRSPAGRTRLGAVAAEPGDDPDGG